MNVNFRTAIFPVALLALVTAAGAASAQQQALMPVALPAMFGADTGFTAPPGSAFVGVTRAYPRGGIAGGDVDGDVSLGMGFGDPVDAIGAEVDIAVTGIDPFGESGSAAVKLSRIVFADSQQVISAAIGAGNLAPWGDAKLSDTNFGATISGLTKYVGPVYVHPIMWTLGYGDQSTLINPGSSETEGGVYAGLGVGIAKYFGVAVSGTKNQMNAGIQLGVPGIPDLGISFGYMDVTDHMDRRQQLLSVSYSFPNLF